MAKFREKQREIELRKWCVEQEQNRARCAHDSQFDQDMAQAIFDWITALPQQSKREPCRKFH